MLSEREKNLMYAASDHMFWLLIHRLDLDVPDIDVKKRWIIG